MTDQISWQPRRPALVAAAVFIAAMLLLAWPIATGQFLAGPASDQFVAGYGFRRFAADYFRTYQSIPLWNPYIFGGLPFVAAMHGDVFYPTAWLRWVLETDTAMNLGLAIHIALAGGTMYGFLRALKFSWTGAVAGGLTWELSGIVAGMVHPGHDGKLFVAALTPLLFLAVLRLVRDRRTSAAGLLAVTVGLALHGHPQLSYYLLVAGALWGAWLLWFGPERPDRPQQPRLILLALAGVALGFGIYAIQALPFYQYIPFSPRGDGGSSGGWAYATAYSLPWSELISAVLPEFNGLKEAYWGINYLKHHTEYFGVIPLALAVFGLGDQARRKYLLALLGIGVLFLLIALGGHTPFYRVWYEVMPFMKKVRAPGMAWFLVAFPLAALAGAGAARLVQGEVAKRWAGVVLGGLGVLGLLGLTGALQPLAEILALPERMGDVLRNADALRAGGVRVLMLALLGLGIVALVDRPRIRPALLSIGLVGVVAADLWSIERQMFVFQGPASETYRDDAITAAVRATALPYRVLDAGVYQGSWLMAHDIPALLGYHGNELHAFDQLMGGKNEWSNLGAPVLFDLFAIRYLIVGSPVELPGWHLLIGPTPTAGGRQGLLYQRDSVPDWVWVVPAAAKIPEDQIIPTLLDDRFPASQVVLFPDTVGLDAAPLGGTEQLRAADSATVTDWRPGQMTVHLTGASEVPSYLVVSENWYPDWQAKVDGVSVPTRRGQYSLITVPLPAGAREVVLSFRSAAYQRGRTVSLISLILALGLLLGPRLLERRRHG